MSIRNADPADLDLLMSLVARLELELPPLPYPEDPADFERGKVEKMVREGIALVAEDEGRADGGVRVGHLGRGVASRPGDRPRPAAANRRAGGRARQHARRPRRRLEEH